MNDDEQARIVATAFDAGYRDGHRAARLAAHPAMQARDAALVQQGRGEGEVTGAARVTAAVEAGHRAVVSGDRPTYCVRCQDEWPCTPLRALRDSGGTDALAAREAAAEERGAKQGRDEVAAAVEAREDTVFLGSMSLMDALYATVTEHMWLTETEPPEPVKPYIWCACGWRSDDLGSDNPAASLQVHLANALHEAATDALQPIVLRKSAVRAAVAAAGASDLAAIRANDQLSADVRDISRMIDASYPTGLDPEARRWRRCAKISEENGEVTEALLGLVGENPRKGQTHTVTDLRKELLDVALAALGALSHVDGNQGDPVVALVEHAAFVADRLKTALADRVAAEAGERQL